MYWVPIPSPTGDQGVMQLWHFVTFLHTDELKLDCLTRGDILFYVILLFNSGQLSWAASLTFRGEVTQSRNDTEVKTTTTQTPDTVYVHPSDVPNFSYLDHDRIISPVARVKSCHVFILWADVHVPVVWKRGETAARLHPLIVSRNVYCQNVFWRLGWNDASTSPWTEAAKMILNGDYLQS